jgi:hypothetical protein
MQHALNIFQDGVENIDKNIGNAVNLLFRIVVGGAAIGLTLWIYALVIQFDETQLTSAAILTTALVVYVSLSYILQQSNSIYVFVGCAMLGSSAPVALAIATAGIDPAEAASVTINHTAGYWIGLLVAAWIANTVTTLILKALRQDKIE